MIQKNKFVKHLNLNCNIYVVIKLVNYKTVIFNTAFNLDFGCKTDSFITNLI